MAVALVMFKADGSRRDFELHKPRMVVGRANSCDLRIPLSSVSREHCEFLIDGGNVRVRDLGSSNGTFHNEVRVQEASLEAGDKVSIGPVNFTLVVDGEPSDLRPESRGTSRQEAPVTAAPPARSAEADDAEAFDLSEQQAGSTEADEDLDATIDLDDPIAALEAMADTDDDDDLQILDDDR